MVKISAILSILAIFMGCIWAARVCNSCGSECAPACGTRYFRSCCFNYLRKKRSPDIVKLLSENHDFKADNTQWSTVPVIVIDTLEPWNDMPSDFKFNVNENRLQSEFM